MKKVRIVIVLGVMGFLLHFFGGIGFFIFPEEVAVYGNLTFPAGGFPVDYDVAFRQVYGDLTLPAGGFTPLLARVMGLLVLLPLALTYLLAALDQAASRSLLIVATSWKALVVLGTLAALLSGMATNYITGGLYMDVIFVLVGIYAVAAMTRQKAAIGCSPA